MLASLVETLSRELRVDASGAKSLAHLLVVVPTAQSGRRLRFALARKLGAFVAPEIRLPAQLLDFGDTSIATRTDEIAAFWTASAGAEPVEISAQLSDIRAILGAKALSFADVAAYFAAGAKGLAGDFIDIETERWRALAAREEKYLAALAARGKIDRIAAAKQALERPLVPEGVEKLIVAGVLGAIPLMEPALAATGLPVEHIEVPRPTDGELDDAQILAFGTAAEEAERIAEYFAAVKSDEELPALCLADAEMFIELKSAFEAKGMKIHNPSSTRLITSSLGHLVAQITDLIRTHSYSVFATFIREGDVRRWLQTELKFTDKDFTTMLTDLDNRQAELLPEKIEDIAPKTEKKLRAVFEFVQVKLRKCGVREILESIFRSRILDEYDEDAREFAAAAGVVNTLIDECFAAGIPEAIRNELFAKRLSEAVYELEPDEGEVILTDGWLELPYLDAKELWVAGFQEGCVPESIVGHPFLPDSLRRALGLPDNEQRGDRDRRILALAAGTRDRDALRVSFHAVSACGDVLKPSRLVFETKDDAKLIARVKRFYGLRAGTRETPSYDLPANWKLKLPVPPEHAELLKTSPTRFDVYMRCPFTAYLKEKSVLGDHRFDDRAQELASWEFGNLAHEALEQWAQAVITGKFPANADAAAISAYLDERVDAWLVDRFGTAIPAVVAMQGESVKRRLKNFSVIQAERAASGWSIVAAEEKMMMKLDHTVFSGKCDRIDFNESLGLWCVIDYKTWDGAENHDKSIQLPCYCSMLETMKADPRFAAVTKEKVIACYCVLGKTKDQVKFTEPFRGDSVGEVETDIRAHIARYEAGIFWPPKPASGNKKPEWVFDYEDWLRPDPKETVDESWIVDQERRIESFDEA